MEGFCQNNETGINCSLDCDVTDAERGSESQSVSGSEVLTVVRLDYLTETVMFPEYERGFMADIRSANL